MKGLAFEGKTYMVDDNGFLLNHDQWDEAFAEGLAPSLKIPRLSTKHWNIICFVRDTFRDRGKCPLVYETCKSNNLRIKELKELFPTGYLRGACKLAGITYKEGYHGSVSLSTSTRPAQEEAYASANAAAPHTNEKTYVVNVRGFLMDPDSWDEEYAVFKSYEMGVEKPLTDQQWKIIYFLRDSFRKNGFVPTVYDTCEANNLEIEDLERLFPHGYHRSAVKIAGLRVR